MSAPIFSNWTSATPIQFNVLNSSLVSDGRLRHTTLDNVKRKESAGNLDAYALRAQHDSSSCTAKLIPPSLLQETSKRSWRSGGTPVTYDQLTRSLHQHGTAACLNYCRLCTL